MKYVTLTRGERVMVDDEDLEHVLAVGGWHRSKIGYAVHSVDAKTKVYMHRFLLGCVVGQHVDHINQDKLDNRRSNLRVCTDHENRMNRPSYKGSGSKFKGVHFCSRKKRWTAQIQKMRRKYHIGYFDLESQAAKAYDVAAREMFGEFAFLNFP